MCSLFLRLNLPRESRRVLIFATTIQDDLSNILYFSFKQLTSTMIKHSPCVVSKNAAQCVNTPTMLSIRHQQYYHWATPPSESTYIYIHTYYKDENITNITNQNTKSEYLMAYRFNLFMGALFFSKPFL